MLVWMCRGAAPPPFGHLPGKLGSKGFGLRADQGLSDRPWTLRGRLAEDSCNEYLGQMRMKRRADTSLSPLK